MNLRTELNQVAEKYLKEAIESSKEIIADNATSFDAMGMSHVKPGEFAKNEITDPENLVNKATIANDSTFNTDSDCECNDHHADEKMGDVVNLGHEHEEDDETHNEDDVLEIIQKTTQAAFGESTLGKFITEKLNGKSFSELLIESDYAGPLDFVPDTRFNASDVLNALKAKIGDAAAGIHVDCDVDADENPYYIISQIDEKELPDTIQIQTVVLKRDGNIYKADKIAKEYPLKK